MALLGNPWAWPRAARLLAASLFLFVAAANARGQITREYDLKAAFLFNFAQFVEWPVSTFRSDDEPFTIGVFGEDPFGRALDEVVRNEKIHGRRFAIQRFRTVEEIQSCQILFIKGVGPRQTGEILAAVKSRKVLTVGDADDFAAQGGIIQFLTDKNRIRLRINVRVAQEEDLTISSKLLRAAEIVSPTSSP